MPSLPADCTPGWTGGRFAAFRNKALKTCGWASSVQYQCHTSGGCADRTVKADFSSWAPQHAPGCPDANLQHGSSPDAKWVAIGSVLDLSGSIVALVCQRGVRTRCGPRAAPPDASPARANRAVGANLQGERFMKLRKTPVASAVALALMSVVYPAQAQDATSRPEDISQTQARDDAQSKASNDKAKKQTSDAKAPDAKPAEAQSPIIVAQAPAPATPQAPDVQKLPSVQVLGIRESLARSLETKRNADSVIEVITADEIGKLPDKNVADALQRLPGVTISSAAGGEGGFDENDRVSMRGTNPSLTQTLINGHAVATGDWFVLDQVGTVGRSVSYSLLPSEIVGQIIVHKSATADLVEGGVAGAVDIITRRPLDFKKNFTGSIAAQAVYADLPQKTDPQFNALVNWKNDAGTAGILLQGFYERRHLRRDGQELLGYDKISPTSPLAMAHPQLANVAYPTLIGSAFFEQERERYGGMVDVQIKPTNDLTLDFNT